MAEFREVVKQYMRMCRSSACEKCVMNCMNVHPWARAKGNPEDFERLVMEWAKEHSEPVYPTWAEWLREMKIIESGISITPMAINDSIYAQIPEDIAKKLGIKPKGASDD